MSDGDAASDAASGAAPEEEEEAPAPAPASASASDADADADEGEAAEPEAQGGGAAAAVVKKRKRGDGGGALALEPVVDKGRLTALRIARDGQDDVTIYRPAPGDHANPLWALWRFADEKRKQANAAWEHLDRVHGAWCEQREPLLGAMRALGRPVQEQDDVQPFQLGPIPRAPLHDDPNDLRRCGRDRFKSKHTTCNPIPWNRLCREWYLEIVEDVADRDGRLYTPGPMPGQQEVVGGGNNKDATLCGAFPHALVRHKIGRLKDKALFVCASTHAVVLTVRLRRKGVEGPVSERDLLTDVHRTLTNAEKRNAHGEFENSLVVYAELQFHSSDQDAPGARIDPDAAFKTHPPAGKLLSPQNSAPYAGGCQEVRMVNGVAEMQFSFNKHVTSSNLNAEHKDRLFQVAVWTLNPYLNEMRGFRKTSSPFVIKATLHNDIQHRQRWVEAGDGKTAVLLTDPTRVLREAPASRSTGVLTGAAAAAAAAGVVVKAAVAAPLAADSSEDDASSDDSESLTWMDQLAAADSESGDSEEDPDFALDEVPEPGPPSESDDPHSSECDSDVGSDLDAADVLPSDDDDE